MLNHNLHFFSTAETLSSLLFPKFMDKYSAYSQSHIYKCQKHSSLSEIHRLNRAEFFSPWSHWPVWGEGVRDPLGQVKQVAALLLSGVTQGGGGFRGSQQVCIVNGHDRRAGTRLPEL